MPVFTATIGLIAAGVGSFFTAASIGSFVLQTAVGVGLSFAAKALAGKPDAQQPAANRVAGVQGSLQAGGDVSRSFPLGRSVTAGSLVYANFWGEDDETPNAFFTQVMAVSDLPLPGNPVQTFINGEAAFIWLDQPHADGRGFPVEQYRKDGKDHLWLKFYDGTQTTADPFLAFSVANAERPWGPTRIGTGVAYVIATSLVNDELFTGFPSFRFELPGVPLYDPSRDTTAGGSGSQRWSDPSTWGGDGDDLPAVQAYNVLRGISFDGDWLYGLQSLSVARLPEVPWINAINTCRASILGEDGFEPTYRAGHECRVNTQIADTVEVLATACHGRLAEIGGVYKLRAGPPGDYVLSFTDDDIINTAEQTFTPFFGLAQKITGITATYPEPAEAWQTKEAPPLYRSDLEVKAGDRRLLSSVAMSAVPYAAQVQRLMKSALDAAQRARRHTYTMPPLWYLLEPLDVVRWSSTRNGYVEKLFEIDGLADRANADQLADITEVDPTDYDWEHDNDFRPVSRSPIAFQRPTAQSIRDWTAQGIVIDDPSGYKRRAAILLSWDGDQPDIAGVAFEVRDADGLLVHRNRAEILGDGASAIRISQNILPGCDYLVRGRYIPANPRETLWSDDIPVTTPDVKQSLVEFEAWIRHQVATLQDQFRDEMDDLRAALQTAANQDARNWNDKQVVKRTFNSRTDEAFAQIEEAVTLATSTQQALADYQVTVTAQFGTVNASITTQSTAIATLNGYAAARYAVTLDVNGYSSGFELLNGGGSFSTATFYTSSFRIVNPLFSPKSVFTVGTINGTPAIGIAANVYLDGTLHARAIQAGTIDTLQLAIGGVDILNIIAGAATHIDHAAISSVTVGTSEVVVCSTTVNCPVLCNALIAGSAGFHSAVTGFVIGSVSYTSAGEEWTKVRIYVDGALVHEDTYSTASFANAGPSHNVTVKLPLSTSAPICKGVVLPAGSHTVEIRAVCANYAGLTAATVFDSGGFAVFQSRR